jgi:hypothetical protein
MSDQKPQRQDSLTEQLRDLVHVANREGMYDAADWIADRISPPNAAAERLATKPVTWLTTDCGRCDNERRAKLPFPERLCTRMIVCPECGNKRCPKASWHGNACTGSNEYGQPGSVYGGPVEPLGVER